MTCAQEFNLRTPRIVLSNQRTSPRYLTNPESPRDAIGHGNRERQLESHDLAAPIRPGSSASLSLKKRKRLELLLLHE
jgi:hypothetical protein